MEHLSAGEFRLSAEKAGYLPYSVDFSLSADAPRRVLDIVLSAEPPTYGLSGAVTDAEGRPLAGATLSLNGQSVRAARTALGCSRGWSRANTL